MSANDDQIAQWNGIVGERWVMHAAETESIVSAFGAAALEAAAANPGERVVDIGCGAGETSRILAEQVGPTGTVLGVDVSAPLLDLARSKAGPANLTYLQADAAEAPLPTTDLLFSRFGVMFFAHPAQAFAHLHRSLAPGGRLAFVCWRSVKENPWAMVPVAAVREALRLDVPAADPEAPGPFAFGDAARVRVILECAGFRGVALKPVDVTIPLGDTTAAAADRVLRIGPASRLVLDFGAAGLDRARAAVEAAFASYAAADGSVHVGGAGWVVTASAA